MMNASIISAVLRYLKARPTFESIGIGPYRQLLENSAKAFKPHRSIQFKPVHDETLEAVWVIPPASSEDHVIFYVHGGGFIAGSINSHKEMASRIAMASRSKLLLFNYRLAPEHPFPQGLNDVKHAYEWLCRQTDTIKSVSIVGDSAGGGLALSLSALILEEKMHPPSCLVLISPWIDLTCKNTSHETRRFKDPMLSQTSLKKTARLYTDKDLSDPLISPINNAFEGICPLLIQVGDNEVLLDDSRILARHLNQIKAPVTLEIWDNMFHVWHYFARYLSDGRKAIQRIGEFIRIHQTC